MRFTFRTPLSKVHALVCFRVANRKILVELHVHRYVLYVCIRKYDSRAVRHIAPEDVYCSRKPKLFLFHRFPNTGVLGRYYDKILPRVRDTLFMTLVLLVHESSQWPALRIYYLYDSAISTTLRYYAAHECVEVIMRVCVYCVRLLFVSTVSSIDIKVVCTAVSMRTNKKRKYLGLRAV